MEEFLRIIWHFLWPLAATIVLEGIVSLFFKIGGNERVPLRIIVLVNVATNPALNYILFILQGLRATPIDVLSPTVLLLEVLVVLIEWKLLEYALTRKGLRLLGFAFVANLVSYGAGVLLVKFVL